MAISYRRNTRLNSGVLHRLGLYGLLTVAPLFLGSNRPLFWGINGMIAALTVAGFAWSELNRPESDRFDWHLPQVALIGMLIIGAWIAIQASPWTPKAWHHPVWFASPMLRGAKSTISADPSLTWQVLGWWSALTLFIVAVRIGTDVRHKIFALELMLSVCVLVASFGLAVELFDLQTLGLLPKIYYTGWVTGTFVNRNSAASFIGMGLIIAIVLSSREYPPQWWKNSTFLSAFILNPGLIYTAAAIELFIALLLTGSRGGIAVGIIGSALVLLFRLKGRRPSIPSIIGFLAAIAISTTFAVTMLQGRTDAADSTNVRLSLYAEAFRAISDRPMLGHGAGAYSSVQPLYHSPSTPLDLIWENAHSTILEATATLGIPAMIFATVILAYIFARLARTLWTTPEEATCLIALLAISVAVTLHAFVDFSLEMQAIAIQTACLAGLGMGENMSLTAETSRKNEKVQLPMIEASGHSSA